MRRQSSVSCQRGLVCRTEEQKDDLLFEMLEISLRNVVPGQLTGQSLRYPKEGCPWDAERFHWGDSSLSWGRAWEGGVSCSECRTAIQHPLSTQAGDPGHIFNSKHLSKPSFPLFE